MHTLNTPFISLNPRHCKACWRCLEACPRQVLGKVSFLWHKHAVVVGPDACIGCGKCVRACPEQCFAQR